MTKPLPFCPRSLGAARFGAFCEKFVKGAEGHGCAHTAAVA